MNTKKKRTGPAHLLSSYPRVLSAEMLAIAVARLPRFDDDHETLQTKRTGAPKSPGLLEADRAAKDELAASDEPSTASSSE